MSRPPPGVEYFNGLGGFAEGGREYVTILGPGQSTPAPWINVVANPGFGFQVSAEGGGCTWSPSNSREHQLTPWSNDPVTDRPGQAFYLEDEETGQISGVPTALPIRDEAATYVARHGRGYSRFEHTSHGIAAGCWSTCRSLIRLKISRLRLTNSSRRSGSIGDRLRRMGSRPRGRRRRRVWHAASTRRARDVRAQRVARGVRHSRRLRRSRGRQKGRRGNDRR